MFKLKRDINVLDLLSIQDEQIITLMEDFLSSGGDVDDLFGAKGKQFTILQACAGFLKPKALLWLLNKGADPNLESCKLTPLNMLVNNYFLISGKDSSYWNNFELCLFALADKGANFNYIVPQGKKPIYLLLEKEQERIPEKVIRLFFNNSTFEDKSGKTFGSDLLKILICNANNFTFENLSYLIEQKKIDLNNKSDPSKSLIGMLSQLSEKQTKQVKRVVDRLHRKYKLDFAQNGNTRTSAKVVGRPIEHVISKKNLSLFKMIVENEPSVLKEKFGSLDIAQFCAMTKFKKGLDFMMKIPGFNWDGKDDLLTLASTTGTEKLIKRSHAKHLYETMDRELKVKVSTKTEKRVKI